MTLNPDAPSPTPMMLATLADRAARLYGVSRERAVELGLNLLISLPAGPDSEILPDPEIIINTALQLCAEQTGFTMDEMLDQALNGKMILSPRKTKIYFARVLRAAGFERRQVRRAGNRPLLWSKPLDERAAHHFISQFTETGVVG